MAISMPSSVTGAAQTGFTSPTYTLTADTPPGVNSKQSAVTALGGTQTAVDIHSASKPFTIAVFRPVQLKVLPQANPLTGIIKDVPNNKYKIKTRKGAVPAANQIPRICTIDTDISVPAGADTYEPEEIRAALSAHIGFLTQLAASIGDTAVTGLL